MATLGEQLKAARERMGATASQAAAATRIKVQHIEAMETNQFNRIPAPTYAKGFIRMYAEYLGIPSGPLVKEYTDQHMPRAKPSLVSGEDAAPVAVPPRPAARPARPTPPALDGAAAPAPADFGKAWRAFSASLTQAWAAFRPALVRVPWRIVAAIVVTLSIAYGVFRIVAAHPRAPDTGIVVETGATVPVPDDVPSIIRDPPEPYLEARAGTAGTP